MTVITRLFPPFSLSEAVRLLASFNEPEFQQFFSEIESQLAFDTSLERCRALADKFGRDIDSIGFLLTVLDFLYEETRERAKDEATIKKLAEELLSSIDLSSISNQEVLERRLVRLLSYNENVERQSKIRRLKEGFLKSATGFSSFVDLRPNINSQRTGIVEFLPMIQFKITTDAEGDDSEMVFHLDERALDKLAEAVDDIKKKLAVLRLDPSVSARIMK